MRSSVGWPPPVPTESDPPPAWGYFPVEQYLIRNWDYGASLLTAEEQRLQLVRAFMREDHLDPGLFRYAGSISRVPNEVEIHTILEPWRPPALRKIANLLMDHRSRSFDEMIFLRTYYGVDSAAERKITEFLSDEYSSDPPVPEEETWWELLNNKSFFDFGEDWQRVYDILPEVIRFCGSSDRTFNPDMATIRRHADGNMRELSRTQKIVDKVHEEALWDSLNTLVLFDKIFFESNDALILFVDKKGNEIRSARVNEDDIANFTIVAFRGNITHRNYWEYANVGPMYRPEGEIGRVYYGTEAQFESMALD